MKLFGLVIVGLAAGSLVGSMAGAAPMTGKQAKAALFAPGKAEVEILAEAGLPEDQAAALTMVAGDQAYYGAIAIAPDEGLMSEATVAAANFHDIETAKTAALAGCEAKKKAGAACVIAGLIRPKGWKDTGFSLSSDATEAFKDYDKKAGVMAISPLTGAFGLAKGDAAGPLAIEACAAKNKAATDCAVVVEK